MIAFIFALLISIVIIIFATQNSAVVSVKLFFWSLPNISLALLVFIAVLLGAIITMLFTLPRYFSLYRKIKSFGEKLKNIEKEQKIDV